MGGLESLVDIGEIPDTQSCIDPPIEDLQRCINTVPSEQVIELESNLEYDLENRFNFSVYATEPTSTPVPVNLGEGEHALNERTLCPWKYKTNSNLNRFPIDIQYAQCQCRNCIDPDMHSLSIMNLCRPIVSWRVVLTRGPCVNGTYQYIEENLPVPVACVCDRRNHLV
nr:interleukin 17-like protein [Lytechinus pictus]